MVKAIECMLYEIASDRTKRYSIDACCRLQPPLLLLLLLLQQNNKTSYGNITLKHVESKWRVSIGCVRAYVSHGVK